MGTDLVKSMVSLCNLRPAVLFWLHLLGLERELDLHPVLHLQTFVGGAQGRVGEGQAPLGPVRQAVFPKVEGCLCLRCFLCQGNNRQDQPAGSFME